MRTKTHDWGRFFYSDHLQFEFFEINVILIYWSYWACLQWNDYNTSQSTKNAKIANMCVDGLNTPGDHQKPPWATFAQGGPWGRRLAYGLYTARQQVGALPVSTIEVVTVERSCQDTASIDESILSMHRNAFEEQLDASKFVFGCSCSRLGVKQVD